jgi:integrase
MTKRKLPPGIMPRGHRWRIDTFYKGVRIRECCATPEMAETNLRKIQTLIDEGRYLEKRRQPKETLQEFSERYLNWCNDIKQKSYASKEKRIKLVVRRVGAETLLSKIDLAALEKYQAERLSSAGERKEHVKPATVNREVACLKHLISKAVEWKILDSNPLRGAKLFKETGRRLRYLTPEECKALLDASSPTMKQVVMLALHTGMRRGEILSLTWDGVNLREGFIELVDQKNGERSTIPLNRKAVETMQSIPRRLDSKYLFPGKTPDKPFYDLKRQFEKAVSAANLDGVTFHVLRHTCASHLVMSGVDLATVKEIMRHKTIEMTLRYAHLSPEHKKSAIAALESALTPKKEKKENKAKIA